MRSLRKEELRLDDEIYRLLITMLKKLKMSKKEEKLVIAEAVSDIYCVAKMMPMVPFKYSVFFHEEEIAKLIFYRSPSAVIFHDLYVTPKYRKQELAKILVVEALSDNRDMPLIQFHARESNKPIHNLTAFFSRKFSLGPDKISATPTQAFYVDGGKAILYSISNPAYEKVKKILEEISHDSGDGGERSSASGSTPEGRPAEEIRDPESEVDPGIESAEVQ